MGGCRRGEGGLRDGLSPGSQLERLDSFCSTQHTCTVLAAARAEPEKRRENTRAAILSCGRLKQGQQLHHVHSGELVPRDPGHDDPSKAI